MTKKSIIGWTAFAVVLIGLSIADFNHDRKQEQKLAEEAFKAGMRVGQVIGGCDAVTRIAAAHPDSDWAKGQPVQDALEMCKKLPQPKIKVRGGKPTVVKAF